MRQKKINIKKGRINGNNQRYSQDEKNLRIMQNTGGIKKTKGKLRV